MTSSQDGVRRKLDFAEKPYTSKTFYLDIKTCKIKLKVTKRISDLGGRVEEFLCKEIHQLITDRDPDEGNQKSKTVLNEKKVGVPLSRGQALLMKATKFTADGNSSMATVLMDPLQKARNLGVQIQLVSIFLKESNKILHKVRQRSNHDELAGCDMEGFSPLTWKRNDKENINVVKLEDSDQMYKPLIKYFDNFPQVRYDDDLISPFDKKIILHRKSETINRYSAKRKSLPAAKKGGFCEACNYWFKCSLREHLNSDKHKKFVDQCHNYKDLDSIIVAMPSVMDFLSKFPSTLIQRDGEREEQSKASIHVYPSVLREKINSSVCLSDDVSLNLISTTSQAERTCNSIEQSKCFAGVNNGADVDKECTSASVNLTLSTLVKNGNQHSSQGHEDIGERRSYDSTCRSSEVDSEQTEMYYPGSAAESVTRDIDNEETRDSGTGPELVDDASVKDSKLTVLCDNSDSALPLDLSTNQHLSVNERSCGAVLQGQIGQLDGTDCDNAVYPTGVDPANLMSRTPETHKNKLLSFEGILKSSSMDSAPGNTVECKVEGSQTKIIRNSHTMPTFSPITSPTHEKCEQPSSFSQLTSNWLKDISTSYGLSQPIIGLSNTKNGQPKLQADCRKALQTVTTDPMCNSANTAAEPVATSLSSCNNRTNQLTPLDLTKASESSVARRLQYISMDSVQSTDEVSLLSQPNGSSFVSRQQAYPSENGSCSYQTSGLSLMDVSENSNSSVLVPLRSENSCSSWSYFTSENSNRMPHTSSGSMFQHGSSYNTVSQDSPLPSDCDTPKALDDSVFVSDSNSTLLSQVNSETVGKPSLKMKISLSGLKKRDEKKQKHSSKKHSRKEGSVRYKDRDSTHNSISHVYVSCQQSDTKLKICKVAVTPTSQNSDLRHFWKVRKSGGCSLVFSSGKRKAERMDSNSSDINPVDSKRRRVLQFL